LVDLDLLGVSAGQAAEGWVCLRLRGRVDGGRVGRSRRRHDRTRVGGRLASRGRLARRWLGGGLRIDGHTAAVPRLG